NFGPPAVDFFLDPVDLTNVTLANNIGQGLYVNEGTPFTMTNTLLGHNSGGNCAAALSGSLAHNPSTHGPCALGGGHENLAQPPSALGNHGGPTLTQMIADGSPAVDHGGFCPPSDQRGFSRTAPGTGLACDIGAVERRAGEIFGWIYLPLTRR